LGDLWSFLGKIFASIITFFYGFTHNYGVAIILMTILIRVILYPLMQKQMVSMREMQKIQPLMKELQEKYKNDKERLNRELMDLYREYKINPMSGCLPLLIQMPILILLFQVLRTFNYSGDPGFLWLKDLSLPDQLVKLPGSGIFGIQYLGIMPFLIGITMFIQQKMTSPAGPKSKEGGTAEQTQNLMNIMMPLLIAFMSFTLPSGLTLYWLTSTMLGIGQQYLINKKIPAIAEERPRQKKEPRVTEMVKEPTRSEETSWIPGYENSLARYSDKNVKNIRKSKKEKKR